VTVPASYDGVSMSVEPGPLYFAAGLIKDNAQSIVAALNTINSTLNDLQLGWAGATAAEAQDFADQWKAAMTGMFGSSNDPSSGVINQVFIAMMSAAANYSNGENSVVRMFSSLQSMLSASDAAQTPDTTPIPAGTSGTPDPSLTAITEINWSGNPGS
jgi:Proteins of 100 residues with WXG